MGQQFLFIEKLSGQNGLLLILIGIERRDTLLGGSVFLIGETLFLKGIQFSVPRQQKRSAVRDLQAVRCDLYTLRHNIIHFFPEVFRIECDTVSEDINDPVTEDTRRKKVKCEFTLLVDDGMAGVPAALETDDHVVVLRQQIDHTALAFISPVDAHDCAVTHKCASPCVY